MSTFLFSIKCACGQIIDTKAPVNALDVVHECLVCGRQTIQRRRRKAEGGNPPAEAGEVAK